MMASEYAETCRFININKQVVFDVPHPSVIPTYTTGMPQLRIVLCKVFMVFILLMYRIKFLLNTPLQVLTVAPALHSLIISDREDAADILAFLSHKLAYLRKLILKNCCLGEESTGLLTKIVDLYPDLEVLSLECCQPITSDGYSLIPRLKKLSELNLHCKVHNVYLSC